MGIRVQENGKQLDIWSSRDEAMAVLAQQLTGTWSACLHATGKGWILVCDGARRFDMNGEICSSATGQMPSWSTPLRTYDRDREGCADSNVAISFDNSTVVRAQVKSPLSKNGVHSMQASISCPRLSSNATIEHARKLAFTLLRAADDAEKVLATMDPRSPSPA